MTLVYCSGCGLGRFAGTGHLARHQKRRLRHAVPSGLEFCARRTLATVAERFGIAANLPSSWPLHLATISVPAFREASILTSRTAGGVAAATT